MAANWGDYTVGARAEMPQASLELAVLVAYMRGDTTAHVIQLAAACGIGVPPPYYKYPEVEDLFTLKQIAAIQEQALDRPRATFGHEKGCECQRLSIADLDEFGIPSPAC